MEPIWITLYIVIGLIDLIIDLGRLNDWDPWSFEIMNDRLVNADASEHLAMVICFALWLPLWVIYHGYFTLRWYSLYLIEFNANNSETTSHKTTEG